ncbi:hypothetical protein [Arthrobacter flavus]|uniref:MAPEG family protein n=1 Tax=Arthrobacter flavus TaxID=95172 RepID=A0ABW4Q9L6_9MICC
MEVLWVLLTLLVAAGVGWPVTVGVLKLARSVDEHEKVSGREEAVERHKTADPQGSAAPVVVEGPPGMVIPDPPENVPAIPAPTAQGDLPAPRPGVLRGGLVIGILERLGVAGAILASEPVAIAYVVAIKGLGRYAELKETPAVAERFIIGTLTSLLWAAGVAAFAAAYLL